MSVQKFISSVQVSVLIADDDPLVCRLARNILVQDGYIILTAATAFIVLPSGSAFSASLGFAVWRLLVDARLAQKKTSAIADEAQSLRKRYSTIIDLESELNAARSQLEQTKSNQAEFDSENERRRAKLNQEYGQALFSYPSRMCVRVAR